jgi:hypothetical protein
MALLNQPLERNPRCGRKFPAEKRVQAFGGERFLDHEPFRARGHFFQRDG